MEKMRKQVLSLLLVFCMLAGIVPAITPSASATSVTLDDLKKAFPEGAYWNHVVKSGHGYTGSTHYGANCGDVENTYTWSPCTTHEGVAGIGGYDCNCYAGSLQCCGFAKKLANKVYGGSCTSWATYSKSNAVSVVKPGDVIHYYGYDADATNGHWVFVTGVSGSTITVGECNYGGRCKINWSRSINLNNPSSLTLYSAPSALTDGTATYTISYNANGGSGAPASQTKTDGVALTLPSVAPTRDGYVFKGWAGSADAATASYQPGGNYTGNSNATLYAVWEKEPDPVTLTAVSVTTAPTKTTYLVGEELDVAGLTLTATYSDGSTDTVTDGYAVSGFDSSTAGSKTVTVTYEGETASFTVTVREAQEGDWVTVDQVPEDAEIMNHKWIYDHHIVSDTAEVDGYTLYDTTSKWSDDWGAWSGWSTTAVSESESRQVETKTVNRTQYNYSKYTQYSNGGGQNGPNKGYWSDIYCSYYFERGWGDQLSTFSNGYDSFPMYGSYSNAWYNQTTRQVYDHTEYRYCDRDLVYTYYLTREVTAYEPVEESESITNVRELVQFRTADPVTLSSISIASAPAKTTYEIGEALDAAGLTLTATYSDGSTDTVTDGYAVSGFDSSTAGSKSVTVTYEGKTASFTVTVNEAAPIDPPTPIDPDAAAIVVGTAKGRPGGTVDVTIALENNPGIVSMLLEVTYDQSVLTLTNVTDAGVFGVTNHNPELGKYPYVLSWENDTAPENFTVTGTIVTLTFAIDDSAEDGDYPISVTYDPECDILNFDLDPVAFAVAAGGVTVSSVIYGDVDGNGKVNALDRAKLARYVAKWSGYDATTVDLAAADVDDSGRVNALDRAILARCVAKWAGYETLPYVKP